MGSTSTTITRKYDGSKRIVQIDQKKGSVYLTGFKYGHDREGHRRFEQKLDSTGTAITGTTYGYDSAYRLINANTSVSATDLASIAFNTPGVPSVPGTPEKQYAYDAAGNRTQTILDSVTTNYTSTGDDADRNQYSEVGGLTQVHDANGNLVDDDSLGFEFSAHDQLVVINDGSDQTRYRYDALGRRFSKEVEVGATTTTVLYKYSGHQVIVEDEYVNGVYNDSKKFVYALGIDESVRVEHVGSGNLYYYGRNSLGSVTALADDTGALVEGYEYAPFGQETILNSSGTTISATAFKNPYRFTGRRADYEEGHGLHFYRSRYYRPETGRFASHDVIGDWGDMSNRGNGVAYCNSDPVNGKDPLGFFNASDTLEIYHKRYGRKGKNLLARARRLGVILDLNEDNDNPGDMLVRVHQVGETVHVSIDTIWDSNAADAIWKGLHDAIARQISKKFSAADAKEIIRRLGRVKARDTVQEDVAEVIVDLTWGMPNTLIGLGVLGINATLGNLTALVTNVLAGKKKLEFVSVNSYGNDIVTVEGGFWDFASSDNTLGVFAFMTTGIGDRDARKPKGGNPYQSGLFPDFFEHMEGHHDWSQFLGPFYFPLMGIPSAISNIFSQKSHAKSESMIRGWFK